MQKKISKTINIALELSYEEACYLLSGGFILADIHMAEFISNGCLDDIEEKKTDNVQISVKLANKAIVDLQFMKAYLDQKGKNEIKSP
jgi:hypothetical protein